MWLGSRGQGVRCQQGSDHGRMGLCEPFILTPGEGSQAFLFFCLFLLVFQIISYSGVNRAQDQRVCICVCPGGREPAAGTCVPDEGTAGPQCTRRSKTLASVRQCMEGARPVAARSEWGADVQGPDGKGLQMRRKGRESVICARWRSPGERAALQPPGVKDQQ